jgi:hypothetical protein
VSRKPYDGLPWWCQLLWPWFGPQWYEHVEDLDAYIALFRHALTMRDELAGELVPQQIRFAPVNPDDPADRILGRRPASRAGVNCGVPVRCGCCDSGFFPESEIMIVDRKGCPDDRNCPR